MNQRAQSETIGVTLLVGVVVITVATAGAFALSDIDSDLRDFDAQIEVTTDSITVVHAGGDPIDFSELLIVVRVDGTTTRIQPDAGELEVGDDDDIFEPGEKWVDDSVSYSKDQLVTVRLFDSNTQLSKDSLYPNSATSGSGDTTDPSVTLNEPNGDETVSGGDTVTVQWTATDSESTVDSVDIAYSTDGGSTWTTIITGTANDGSYDWTIPDEDTDQALVRVFASDNAGNIGSGTSDGTFTIGGSPPTASLSTADSTAVGRPTTFDASGSSDPDGGSISEYRWDFDGDGSVDRTTTAATVSHTYWQAGDYNATVTVVDDEGETTSASQPITVNATVRMGVSPDSGTGQTDVDLLGLVDRSPDDALVNFSETTVGSYSGSQDDDGNYDVTDNGRELVLRNNTWKKIPYNYGMSPNTIIAVDFRSPEEGEIQGVALDNDIGQSDGLTYNLYGSQNWGITRYSYTTAPDWERFSITAGEDYTVNAQYLGFVNDDDGEVGDSLKNGVMHVRDVMVYEDDTVTYDYAWDVGRDGTTDFTGKQPTRSLGPGTHDVTLTVSYVGNGSVVGAVNRTITIESEEPPVADFEYTPSSPTIDESVSFDASNSTDPDGGSLSYEWDFGDGSANATGVSPSHSYNATGNYTVTLTVTDDEGETTTTTKQVEVEPEFVYALNAGGPERTYDVTYVADQGTNPYQQGSTNTASTGNSIANTTQDTLYQTERYGDFSYDIPVEDGTYRVTVKLAETYWNNDGQRVFDVLLEDERVVDDIDIHQRVGHDHALDLTFTKAVTDGTLDIDFVTETDNAKLSAVKVEQIGPATSDSPKFAGTAVHDLSAAEDRFRVDYNVTDRTQFQEVRVQFENQNSGNVVTRTNTAPRGSVEYRLGYDGNIEYDITLQLVNDSGIVIEEREVADTANGENPAGNDDLAKQDSPALTKRAVIDRTDTNQNSVQFDAQYRTENWTSSSEVEVIFENVDQPVASGINSSTEANGSVRYTQSYGAGNEYEIRYVVYDSDGVLVDSVVVEDTADGTDHTSNDDMATPGSPILTNKTVIDRTDTNQNSVRYEVEYETTDWTAGSRVEVRFQNLEQSSASGEGSSTDASGSVNYSQSYGANNDYRIRIELYDDNGILVDSEVVNDTADGISPGGGDQLPAGAVAYADSNQNGTYDFGEQVYSASDLQRFDEAVDLVISRNVSANGYDVRADSITVQDGVTVEVSSYGGTTFSARNGELRIAGTLDTSAASGQQVTLEGTSVDLTNGEILTGGQFTARSTGGDLTADNSLIDVTAGSESDLTLTTANELSLVGTRLVGDQYSTFTGNRPGKGDAVYVDGAVFKRENGDPKDFEVSPGERRGGGTKTPQNVNGEPTKGRVT